MIDQSARDSWELLTQRLRGFVGRRVPPGEVDDVVQEILVRIYRGVRDLSDESRFGPWVYRVARNAVIDRLRQRSVPSVDAADLAALESREEAADSQPLVECVAPFVTRLPAPYRDALTLVELRGLSQQEAADIAGISLSGMKSRVQRGRRLLRTLLEECCTLTFDGRRRVIDAERREASGVGGPCASPCRDR